MTRAPALLLALLSSTAIAEDWGAIYDDCIKRRAVAYAYMNQGLLPADIAEAALQQCEKQGANALVAQLGDVTPQTIGPRAREIVAAQEARARRLAISMAVTVRAAFPDRQAPK